MGAGAPPVSAEMPDMGGMIELFDTGMRNECGRGVERSLNHTSSRLSTAAIRNGGVFTGSLTLARGDEMKCNEGSSCATRCLCASTYSKHYAFVFFLDSQSGGPASAGMQYYVCRNRNQLAHPTQID